MNNPRHFMQFIALKNKHENGPSKHNFSPHASKVKKKKMKTYFETSWGALDANGFILKIFDMEFQSAI